MADVREATESDVPFVRELLAEYLLITWPEVTGQAVCTIDDLPAFSRDELADPLGAFDRVWLARDGGAVAGVVALRRHSEGVGEMKRLFVREGYRRSGIATALADAVIDAARRRGDTSIVLDTLPSRSGALRFFDSLGFRETAPFSEYPFEMVFLAMSL